MNTSILHHPWLPDKNQPYVTTQTPILLNQQVSSLFTTGAASWDYDLVHDMFNPRDANLILGLPLSSIDEDGCWYWIGESNGSFSVSNAYLLLQKEKAPQPAANNFGFWKELWQLKILPKLGVLCQTPFATFASWLEQVFSFTATKDMCKIMACWALWKARNKKIGKNQTYSLNEIMVSAFTSLDHWRKAQDIISLSSIFFDNISDQNELWVKPEIQTIKINVDAAVLEQENSYRFGFIDHHASPLHIQAMYHGGYFLAETMEAMGIKEALSWIKTNNWKGVMIESDNMLAVQASHSTQPMTSVFGQVVSDCRNLLSSLSNVSLRFVRRSANRAAHFVSRHAWSFSGHNILETSIPP
uniref:RNase H type-1 domain-containing protein n=1 Tax=Cannabis sativa TaxID=3483 RepID=A0A803QQ60_CANSA